MHLDLLRIEQNDLAYLNPEQATEKYIDVDSLQHELFHELIVDPFARRIDLITLF